MSHSVPGVTCIINSVITGAVLYRGMIKPIMFFGVIYIGSNFASTKLGGEPVYEFLHWEDPSSLCIALGILLFVLFFYIILCSIDESIKWDKFLSRHKGYWKKKGSKFPTRNNAKNLFKKNEKKKTK